MSSRPTRQQIRKICVLVSRRHRRESYVESYIAWTEIARDMGCGYSEALDYATTSDASVTIRRLNREIAERAR